MTEDRKEYFYTKNKLNFKNYQENNLKRILYQKLIAGDVSSKLTFKHQCVNMKCKKEIDYMKSESTMKLQKSKYIMIEDDVTTYIEKKD
jgi:hypothetical protein